MKIQLVWHIWNGKMFAQKWFGENKNGADLKVVASHALEGEDMKAGLDWLIRKFPAPKNIDLENKLG